VKDVIIKLANSVEDSLLYHSLALLALVASVGRVGADTNEILPSFILHPCN